MFETALAWILKWEGGYVNHPLDRGGPTNMGITKRTYDAYRASKKLVAQGVDRITKTEVQDIYRNQYFKQWDTSDLSQGAKMVLFNISVLSGTNRASVIRGRALSVAPDQKSKAFVSELLNQYDLFLGRIVANNPSQKVFQRGWANRQSDLRRFLKQQGLL